MLKINKRKTKTGATVIDFVTPSLNNFCFSQALPQSRSQPVPQSLLRSLKRSSVSHNRSPLSIAHDTTHEIHESTVSKESRVKISPSTVTTAQVMLKSSSFASPNTGFFLIWGLGFLVEFCPPLNFFLFFFSDSHLPFLYLAD